MYLFGVVHKQKHLDTQVAKIEEMCSVDGKVIMLELAPNYEENVQKGVLRPNFFVQVTQRYRPRCARVILGDQELTIPENPNWILSCVLGEGYMYPDNRRDEIMRRTIKTELPDIVLVGNGHSDEIKQHFPQAHYTVFQENGGYAARFSSHGRPHNWHRPDLLITL